MSNVTGYFLNPGRYVKSSVVEEYSRVANSVLWVIYEEDVKISEHSEVIIFPRGPGGVP